MFVACFYSTAAVNPNTLRAIEIKVSTLSYQAQAIHRATIELPT
jgi:hypothetical protein